MTEIVRSATFSNWLSGLADSRARARIQALTVWLTATLAMPSLLATG